jgi:hypothetical protein
MIAFIYDNSDVYGVETICRVLPLKPGTGAIHLNEMVFQAVLGAALEPSARPGSRLSCCPGATPADPAKVASP